MARARAGLVACAGLGWVLLASACIPALPHGRARAPHTDVPPNYGGPAETTNSAQLKWSEFFTDPKLNALIDAALKNNQELHIVSLEVDIANSEIIARRGEYLPKVDFGLGVGIEKVGRYTSQGASDEAHRVPTHLPNFAFGLSASWEIDIWSKLRNATRAATLRYLASKEGRNFAVTMLVGEIASSYYELVALDAELDLLKQNTELQKSVLAVVKLQKEAAKATELAVTRFEAEVLKNQSRQYVVQQQIVETEARINFLLGRFPQHVDRSELPFADVVPPIVHTGIPSQLLDNRPDVKQAQLELAAADLDFRVAKAGFYPALGLSANIGFQSFDISKLVATPASLIYSIGADLLAPLINRSALTSAYFTANSKQMQAVYSYERAILSGYIEVVKRLAAIHNLEESYALQVQQVDKLKQSIDISSRLFTSARADYMEVLLTRRDALEAQMELIENKKQQMTATVGLYRTLGGGWR
ncbi:MAG TPA: TolC family protein [Polyangia bacterium]|jgi:NodT family efflux transporter outer membrane factor (OMF) lipoprotein|nr:TolC family protein [Polyangia bacterium]